MRRLITVTGVLLLGSVSAALAQEGQMMPPPSEMPAAVPQTYPATPAAEMAPATQMTPTPVAATSATPVAAEREWPVLPEFSNRRHPPAAVGPQGGSAIPTLPLEIRTAGDITYVTGGIGDEEEAMLKDRYNEFNFHLLMSAASGEYISNAMLRLLDSTGNELLSISDAGPYFYAQLKPGVYTVEVTATQGGIKKAKIKIPAKGSVREHVTFME